MNWFVPSAAVVFAVSRRCVARGRTRVSPTHLQLAAGLMDKNYHLARAQRDSKSASFVKLLRRNLMLVEREFSRAMWCRVCACKWIFARSHSSIRKNAQRSTGTQKAVFTLIAIRKFRRSESGLLGHVPRELVDRIARFLWSSRHDAVWDDELWRSSFMPAIDVHGAGLKSSKSCSRCGGHH